jgi:hypothetical protein
MAIKKVLNDKHRNRVRMVGDKIVQPCMYGNKRFMTGVVGGEVVVDHEGNPVSLKEIGELV